MFGKQKMPLHPLKTAVATAGVEFVWGSISLYTETFISMEPAAQGPSSRILRLGLTWWSRG